MVEPSYSKRGGIVVEPSYSKKGIVMIEVFRRAGVLASHYPSFGVKQVTELGGDYGLMAAASQGAPQNLFTVTGAIGVGRIEEIDTKVHRAVNGANGGMIVYLPPAQGAAFTIVEGATNCPTAQADGANLNAQAA